MLRYLPTIDASVNSSSAIKFTARARPATEPTSSNQQQWVKVLWVRLERVVEDVANCCIKVIFKPEQCRSDGKADSDRYTPWRRC